MKSNKVLSIGMVALLTACAGSRQPRSTEPAILGSSSAGQGYYENARRTVPPFVLVQISTDSTYGFTAGNSIKVGGGFKSGAYNQQRYLNALRGPEGQEIIYARRGSCCMFKTPNGMNNTGLLDAYEIKWEGLKKPLILYLNLYEESWLKAPKGFTTAN